MDTRGKMAPVGGLGEVVSVDQKPARCGVEQAGARPKQCALTAALEPCKSHDLARSGL